MDILISFDSTTLILFSIKSVWLSGIGFIPACLKAALITVVGFADK